MTPNRFLTAAALVFAMVLVVSAQRRDAFVQSRLVPAIAYDKGPVDDSVSRANAKLDSGMLQLKFDPASGYLRSVLDALNIPIESQSLVFSQTSFQGDLVNVRNPRALFFNDTAAVGWVRGADVLEVAAHDPKQGMIFYTVEQKAVAKPRFTRDDNCLACHLSWETLGVPGMTIQSVNPLPDENSYVIGFFNNHASPFTERFGGWYVTGSYGGVRHMGNIPVMPVDKGKLKVANPFELASVQGLFDPAGYPTSHSDVVALLVLAHQVSMTNHLTRLGWEARVAAASPSADASARVREAARDAVDYMLFIDEEPLRRPVKGTSGFTERFSAQGPKDKSGRSLHALDLQTRLLKYPLSYMIYSPAFDALPRAAKDAAYTRLFQVLSGQETAPRYARLKRPDREAILQILRDTKPDLPAPFRD